MFSIFLPFANSSTNLSKYLADDEFLLFFFIATGQPLDYLMQLFLRSALFLNFREVVRIYRGERQFLQFAHCECR